MADARNLPAVALETHHRCSGDDAQMAGVETSKLADHFLGHAVAEVVLRSVSGEVLEWQDGDHHPLALRPPRGSGVRSAETGRQRYDDGCHDCRAHNPLPRPPLADRPAPAKVAASFVSGEGGRGGTASAPMRGDESTVTAAIIRYPTLGRVSTYLGCAAESLRRPRSSLTAVLRPCSKSTNVSFDHSSSRSSSLVTTSPARAASSCRT